MNDHSSHAEFRPLIRFDFTDTTPPPVWCEAPELMKCDQKAMETLTTLPLPCKLPCKGLLMLSTMVLSSITLAYLNQGSVELDWDADMEAFYAAVVLEQLPEGGDCAEILHSLSKVAQLDAITKDERLVILPTLPLRRIVSEPS